MTNSLYPPASYERDYKHEEPAPSWRGNFSRDYARVIHSASFRRLQGKTQVFPGHESDFFRNRLTHSLEVAQIAEGIAERLNEVHEGFKSNSIDGKLCATAALIHDLGHPPFGHNGERALDHAMLKYGGFEGNAQTLRIITKLEKKIRDKNDGERHGLNLTYRTLAAILKYDRKIPRSRRDGSKIVKGYYESEAALVGRIKDSIAGGKNKEKKFKSIECSIMDLADDIAYSTYDFEDSLKAGFLTPGSILSSNTNLVKKVSEKVEKELNYSFSPAEVMKVFLEIFSAFLPQQSDEQETTLAFGDLYRASQDLANSGYFRTQLSSQLVGNAIKAVDVDFNKDSPILSTVKLEKRAMERVEVLKQFTFVATIYSSRVMLPEYRGYEVVKGIFNALAGDRGELLMPEDVREHMEECGDEHDAKMRIICDFVAGMTDRYAMEFFGRLHSDSPQSMFKPI